MKKFALILALLLAMFLASNQGFAAQPSVGEPAPDFKLQDQNNRWHTLDSFRGNWVALYFYPKADTPGCTTESCAFRDDIFKFKKMGVKVVGVSLDDVASQKAFAEKYHLPFPLLSDAKQDLAKSFGVMATYGEMTIAKRETFIISPEGTIAKHYKKVNPDSHSTQVLADMEQLIAAAKVEEVGVL
ncbi:MAG: peroxiredoxin [Pseudomonadota bacterium]